MNCMLNGIIIEGAENTGKTTLCTKLMNLSRVPYLHMSKNKGQFDYVNGYLDKVKEQNKGYSVTAPTPALIICPAAPPMLTRASLTLAVIRSALWKMAAAAPSCWITAIPSGRFARHQWMANMVETDVCKLGKSLKGLSPA